MTEGAVTNAIVKKANEGLEKFPQGAFLQCVELVDRSNADDEDYSTKNHVKPLESLKREGLLGGDGAGLPAAMFVMDGASMELLIHPVAGSTSRLEREVLAIRFVSRNGGYAFWASDADLQRAPCKDQGPGKCRMAAKVVFEGGSEECYFVICETSEAMNRATISAVKHNLLPGEELGSPAWCRRVYDCGPDIYREPEVFRLELLESLLGTGALFEGKGGMDFGSSHEEQARRPWFIIMFASKNGFGFAGTAVRSEIVGCVYYELGLDACAYIEVFRNNRGLAEDLVNIVMRLSKDLSCFDKRYDPRVRDEACLATTRCQLMLCYQQKGHYQIGPKKNTVKKSDVHGRFWTPPITSCESAQVLRQYGYEVMTPEGPSSEHGGGPHSLFYGVASWAMGEERKGYETVREPIPKPEPRENKRDGKPSKPGWRDRRKMRILSGEGYAVKTPRREVPVLKSGGKGDLTGERIMVLWEKGSHRDVMDEDALYCGLVQSFDASKGTHHIIYDDFAEEDEHLDELKYKLKQDGEWKWVVGTKWAPVARAGKKRRPGASPTKQRKVPRSVEAPTTRAEKSKSKGGRGLLSVTPASNLRRSSRLRGT